MLDAINNTCVRTDTHRCMHFYIQPAVSQPIHNHDQRRYRDQPSADPSSLPLPCLPSFTVNLLFSHTLVFLFLFPRSPSDTKQSRALRALFHLPLRLIASVRAETRDGARRNYTYTEMYTIYLPIGIDI